MCRFCFASILYYNFSFPHIFASLSTHFPGVLILRALLNTQGIYYIFFGVIKPAWERVLVLFCAIIHFSACKYKI